MDLTQNKNHIQLTFKQNWTLEHMVELQNHLNDALKVIEKQKKLGEVILNFHAVVVMDTAGLKLFLSFIKSCSDLKKQVSIQVSSTSLRRVLSYCGLKSLFTLQEMSTHEYHE